MVGNAHKHIRPIRGSVVEIGHYNGIVIRGVGRVNPTEHRPHSAIASVPKGVFVHAPRGFVGVSDLDFVIPLGKVNRIHLPN